MTMRDARGPQGAEEEAWAARFEKEQELENGYRTQQRDPTADAQLRDDGQPRRRRRVARREVQLVVGHRGDDIESVYTKDELLTNIMIYVVTRTFNTASWIYYGRREEAGRVLSPEGGRVEVPTACALFPEELLSWPPRSYVERVYNVTRWTEFPRGGHFAAMEQPEPLVEDIRAFAARCGEPTRPGRARGDTWPVLTGRRRRRSSRSDWRSVIDMKHGLGTPDVGLRLR